MTAQRDTDVRIDAFLDEGPAELSPHLLAAIRDDVHVTRQRVPQRLWRTPQMSRSLAILLPLVAALLVGGALLLGAGGRQSPSPDTTPPASAVVGVPAATPSAVPSDSSATPVYPIASGEPWIAYDGGEGIRLVRPDGSGDHPLLADDGDMTTLPNLPDWSPDGGRLVFVLQRGFASEVWTVDADGTNLRRLTADQSECGRRWDCTFNAWPRWSPDGASIALVTTSLDAGRFMSNTLSVIDVATGRVRTLFESSTELVTVPSWSPDGTTIAVGVEAYGNGFGDPATETWIATVAPTDPAAGLARIPGTPAFAGHPDWGDDGIVFRTAPVAGQGASDGSSLQVIQPDGTGLTRILSLEPGPTSLRAPSWTPDGRSILFVMRPADSALGDLRIVEADGSSERSATGGATISGTEPRMRPTP